MSFSMSFIHGYPSLHPLNSQLKRKQKLHTNNELLWLPSGEKPTRLALHSQRITSLRTTYAITDSMVLGVTSAAKSGDISVFLQTSAVMLLLYFIANFVVPSFISKSLEFEEENEDSSPKV